MVFQWEIHEGPNACEVSDSSDAQNDLFPIVDAEQIKRKVSVCGILVHNNPFLWMGKGYEISVEQPDFEICALVSCEMKCKKQLSAVGERFRENPTILLGYCSIETNFNVANDDW